MPREARENQEDIGQATKDLAKFAKTVSGRDARGLMEVVKEGLKALELVAQYKLGKLDKKPTFDRRVRGCHVKISAAGWVIIDVRNKQNMELLQQAFNREIKQKKSLKLLGRRKAQPAGTSEEPKYGLVAGSSALSANNLELIEWGTGNCLYLVHQGESPEDFRTVWREEYEKEEEKKRQQLEAETEE